MNRRILILLVLWCASFSVNAGIETFTSRLPVNGKALEKAAVINVTDDKYPNFNGVSRNHAVKNFIVLAIEHSELSYLNSDYVVAVDVTVEATGASGQQTVYNKTLQVDYKPNDPSFTDKDVFAFTGAHIVDVTINKIYDPAFPAVEIIAPVKLKLEVVNEVERIYTFDHNLQLAPANDIIQTVVTHQEDLVGGTGTTTIPDELIVKWKTIDGAEEYDLEWTHVNDYDESGDLSIPRDPNLLNYTFANATRVSVSENQYSIPLVFERGYVVYRIRPVGRAFDLNDGKIKVVSAKWSLAKIGTVGALTDGFYPKSGDPNLGHEGEKMNWQFIANFAEEGKRKSSVSYFDGSLRNRQVVSRLNSEDEAIAGETVYDNQGRAALQVLPVPTTERELKYYRNFNQNQAGDVYSRDDFDVDNGACVIAAEGMKDASGASKYYSPNQIINNDDPEFQNYVPDANDFPFTQIEFEPDNTGRIRRQSGVRPDHVLGSGHETQYFYGQPYQEQLDRLFGSEVGFNCHYKKNLVLDANGQASVSYLDMQGRVIATSLAGDPPSNMEDLESSLGTVLHTAAEEQLTVNLIAGDVCNTDNTSKEQNSISTELLVPDDTEYSLTYDVTGGQFTDDMFNCPGVTNCYDCIYDLEIRLQDKCSGSDVITPYIQTIGGALDDVCSSPAQLSQQFNNIQLDPGTYTLSKTLRVNKEAVEFYSDKFVENNTCLLTLQDFVDDALDEVDLENCNLGCDECLTTLGYLDGNGDVDPSAEVNYIADGGTSEEFQQAVSDCKERCTTPSPCEVTYAMLLMDMSKGGQYGTYLNGEGEVVPSHFALSIFNQSNGLPGSPSWKIPSTPYVSEDGSASVIELHKIDDNTYSPAVTNPGIVVTDFEGISTTTPQNLANVEDFLDVWETSWAKSLVSYHPEYCYYEWCMQLDESILEIPNTNPIQSRSSFAFDIEMRTTVTYPTGNVDYLLQPLGDLTAFTTSCSTSCNCALIDPLNVADPFFQPGALGEDFLCDMAKAMVDYQGTGLDIWEAAAASFLCGTCFGDVQPSCTDFFNIPAPDRDKAWQFFAAMYQGEKLRFLEQAQTEYSIDNGCYNGCIGESPINPFEDNFYSFSFPGSGEFLNSQQPCYFGSYYKYGCKKRRFNKIDDILPFPASVKEGFSIEDGDLDGLADELRKRAEYEMWLSTGECAFAIELESLIEALYIKGDYNNDPVSLKSYPEFGQNMYELFATTPPFVEQFWHGEISVDNKTLTANIDGNNINGVGSGCITLSFDVGSSFDWTSTILGFQEITFQEDVSGTDHFTMVALIESIQGAETLQVREVLQGTTSCIPLNECSFDDDCRPTQAVKELERLMIALAGNGQLDNGSDIPLSAPYDVLLTGSLGRLLKGGGGTTFTWKKTGPDAFRIQDENFFGLDIVFSNVTGFAWSTITTFKTIAPDPDSPDGSGFTVIGITTGETLLKGNLNIVELANNFSQLVNTGECGLPIPAACNTIPHRIRGELENFLTNLAMGGDIFNPGITDEVALENFDPFTDLLRCELAGENWQWDPEVSTDGLTLTGTFDYVEGPNNFSPCPLQLNFVNVATIKTFGEIIKFSDLTADNEGYTQGKMLNFSVIAHFADGSTEELSGSSCFPVANCDVCVPNEELAEGSIELDFLGGSTDVELFVGTLSVAAVNGNYSDVTELCQALVDEVNNNVTSPDYVAEFFVSGSFKQIIIRGASGTGSLPNGKSVSLTINSGSVTILNTSPMAGGINVGYEGLGLLTNGDFEQGNTGFSTDYSNPPTGDICGLQFGHFANTEFGILNSISCEDLNGDQSPTSSGNYLLAGDRDFGPLPAPVTRKLWAKDGANSLTVIANTDYTFRVWYRYEYHEEGFGVAPYLNDLKLLVNSQEITSVTVLPDKGEWKLLEGIWNSGASTSAEPQIDNIVRSFVNYLAIDAIEFTKTAACSRKFRTIETPYPPIDQPEDPCQEQMLEIAFANGLKQYELYIDGVKDEFETEFTAHCLEATENLTATYIDKEYHFTLYYYDQAGNLIKTVPPEGTKLLDQDDVNAVAAHRADPGNFTIPFVPTNHEYITRYTYNSLNQLTSQEIPDHDPVSAFSLVEDDDPAFDFSSLQDVFFTDANTGFAVGGSDIFKTVDAGSTWQVVHSSASTHQLQSVVFTNNMNGVAVSVDYTFGGTGQIFRTTDGGATWDFQGGFDALHAVDFLTPLVGYAIGDDNYVLKTTNGGGAWSVVTVNQLGLLGKDFVGIDRMDNNTAIFVTSTGEIGFIDHAAANVDLWGPGISGVILEAVHVLNDQTVYVGGESSGDGTIWKTTNGGTSWSSTSFSGAGKVNDIVFGSINTGYAVTDNRRVLRTEDAGQNWVERIDGSNDLTAVFLSTDGNIYIAGNAITSGSGTFFTGTPSRFSTRFWYDALGRLRFSQNAEQLAALEPTDPFPAAGDYSYTKYDALGRIVEVGESEEAYSSSFPNLQDFTAGVDDLNFPSEGREVTRSFYDNQIFTIGSFNQNNLRNRVVSVGFYDIFNDGVTPDNGYNRATHYSYDIHGNVADLLQENLEPALVAAGQGVKKVGYEYDLVSGNVNLVKYQEGYPDQFFHCYEYDADNRITNVFTSTYAPSGSSSIGTDGRSIQGTVPQTTELWDQDAKYFYYKHGPLARAEVGNLKVQAQDYVYTIQGWIKGTNSNSLDVSRDIGEDGLAGNLNNLVTIDAFGYSLGYFDGDYIGINGQADNNASDGFLADIAGTFFQGAANDLFNGNIRHMVTSLTKPDGTQMEVQGTAYKYDQLNRIASMESYNGSVAANNDFSLAALGGYLSSYSYDQNGNLLTLSRSGVDDQGNNKLMDNLMYTYEDHNGTKKTNRLLHVDDDLSISGNFGDDIDDQAPNNYAYDEIGNLIQDNQEEIASIRWTVYGKVEEVIRTNGTNGPASNKSDIEFDYDANGNRVIKIVKPRASGVLTDPDQWTFTYYVRDASGNVMGTYEGKYPTGSSATFNSLTLKEKMIYGSSRVGLDRTEVDMLTATAQDQLSHDIGNKTFEFSNHLGNVLVTVSDLRKLENGDGSDVGNNGVVDFYTAGISSASDYYPFGMQMSQRSLSSGSYRYGFNGMEKDDELKGEGNSYDFGARIHDPRLGRFLSMDPFVKPGESPYTSTGNNPIWFVDVDGEDTLVVHLDRAEEVGDAIIFKVTITVIRDGIEEPVDLDLGDAGPNAYIAVPKSKWVGNNKFASDDGTQETRSIRFESYKSYDNSIRIGYPRNDSRRQLIHQNWSTGYSNGCPVPFCGEPEIEDDNLVATNKGEQVRGVDGQVVLNSIRELHDTYLSDETIVDKYGRNVVSPGEGNDFQLSTNSRAEIKKIEPTRIDRITIPNESIPKKIILPPIKLEEPEDE